MQYVILCYNFSTVKSTKEVELICSKVKHKDETVTAEWKIAQTGETLIGCQEGINI